MAKEHGLQKVLVMHNTAQLTKLSRTSLESESKSNYTDYRTANHIKTHASFFESIASLKVFITVTSWRVIVTIQKRNDPRS